ncbi:MAG: hypothetical protein AB7H88_12380 [Vicinamibacterales bacterium]
MRITTSVLGALALVGALVAVPASAQTTPQELTHLTFDHPVRVPGVTLPAGSYVFRLADAVGTPDVIQILDANQTRLLATVFAVPSERLQPAGEPSVTLASTGQGAPAIKAWYFPGDVIGHEFVYPERQAREMARSTDTVVKLNAPDKVEHIVAAPRMANGDR